METDKELAMAVRELRRINADEQMRAILEQREKDEHDRVSDLDAAREEEALAIAQKMLALNLDPTLISQVTGVTLSRLKQLQAEKNSS